MGRMIPYGLELTPPDYASDSYETVAAINQRMKIAGARSGVFAGCSDENTL
jgi:hypothetical protein